MDQVTEPVVETPRVYSKKEEALIERHRDMNVDHNWWTGVEDQVKGELAEIGFDVTQMHFSGFWSQGDGACFEGKMVDWTKFCAGVPTFVKAFPFLSEYLKDEGATYSITYSGHYCHEHCTEHDYSSELEWDVENFPADPTDPEKQMLHALWTKALSEECDVYECDVYEWLKEFFKDKMRDLYKRLEEEHDYLTSDDVVWESLEANDLDKQDTLDDDDDEDSDDMDGDGRDDGDEDASATD